MKKRILIALISILSFNCYSQIEFESGYFINNNGEQTNCLIKNIDWKNNPVEFKYKLSENSESKTATITSVKEFGVLNTSKYHRFIVNIDRSSENINNLSVNKNPQFNEEQLFLKVFVEGKASLYFYEDGNLIRYFYSHDNSNVEQLIFKSYKTPENKIGKNNRYKQQLWNNLKCEVFSMSDLENIGYNKRDLVKFFIEYNECKNSEFINFEKNQKKDLFNLTIRPGLNFSSLSIQNSASNSRDTDFGNKLGLRLGIEVEFIMPFNKNKWAILIEPTYQYFNSEKILSTQTVNADYKSIELPIGIRHYFFLNDNSKIFINGAFVFDFSFNSKIDFENGNDLDITTRKNIVLGLGYNFKNKYSLEMRYGLSREILSDYIAWTSNYRTFSIIFGYNIF